MLGVRTYPREFIDTCRARVESDVASYRTLAAGATDGFESTFFNNMLVVLDHSFVHRLRTVEGKDGNPLNEVRVLCDSLLSNKGLMGSDKTINLAPAKSVLKHQVGDPIKLTAADFERISEAFFAEIERKFR